MTKKLSLEERDKLLEKVLPLIRSIVKGDEDLFQEACVLMLKRLHTYDSELGALTTFTVLVTKQAFRKRMYNGVKLPERPIDNPPIVFSIDNNSEYKAADNISFNFDVLDPLEEYFILEHFFNNTTKTELARLAGYSTTYVHKIIKQALGKLKDAYIE